MPNNIDMNLFDYAKLIGKKIKGYDKVAQNPFTSGYMSNPFERPINITLVWVEPEEDKKDNS